MAKACRTCFPDAPRYDAYKPYCTTCRSNRPCKHNGGMILMTPVRTQTGRVELRRRWVWPDSPKALDTDHDLMVE